MISRIPIPDQAQALAQGHKAVFDMLESHPNGPRNKWSFDGITIRGRDLVPYLRDHPDVWREQFAEAMKVTNPDCLCIRIERGEYWVECPASSLVGGSFSTFDPAEAYANYILGVFARPY